MAEFTGTQTDDVIDGTEGDDVIEAFGGNDTVNGLGGNDRINGGDGTDTINGGEGDDTIVLTYGVVLGETFAGGNGFDTLEFGQFSNFGTFTNDEFGSYAIYVTPMATVTGIEQLSFASTLGMGIFAIMPESQITGSGITHLLGNVGRDALITTVSPAGAYTMPAFTFSDWTISTSPPHHDGDFVGLTATGAGDFTLNSREGLASVQYLGGGSGNDTLNGSSGADTLNGAGGTDVLNGNSGDDILIISNVSEYQGPVTSNHTGAGSTFNGGLGTDTLSIAGPVQFLGTLSGVEAIYLRNGYSSALEMDPAHFAMLPTAFSVGGAGFINVNLAQGESFDFSSVVYEEDSYVDFVFEGENGGSPSAVTWIGTSEADQFAFGTDSVTVTGGGGGDFYFVGFFGDSARDVTITDFTAGDKFDVSDIGIDRQSRLADFMSQVGSDVLLSTMSGGVTAQVLIENIALADLTYPDDFFWMGARWSPVNVTGTGFGDVMFGYDGADNLAGGDGNDVIYTGGGLDTVSGGSGNDHIIVDGHVPPFGTTIPGGSYDGGSGNDTMTLRPEYSTSGPFGPTSQFTFASNSGAATFAGIETLEFVSILGQTTAAQMSYAQVTGGGIATVAGGAGYDRLTMPITGGGSFTMPTVTLQNWTTGSSYLFTDSLQLIATDNANYSLHAIDGLDGYQTLLTGNGDDNLFGSNGVDALLSGGGVDTLYGGGGNDLLNSGAGNDTLIGDTGNDTLVGGLGDDIYFVDAAGDLVFDVAGQGNDRIVALASFVLSATSEIETLETVNIGGTGAIDLTGSDTANLIIGNNGVNTLFGQGGADAIHGFAGADYLFGGTGLDNLYGGAGDDAFYIGSADGDRIWEQASEGYDTVSTEFDYELPDTSFVERLEAGTLTATSALYLGGSYLDNLIIGNAGNNTLRGFAGADTMHGLGGDDVLIGDEGADVMYGGTGNDTFYVNTSDDRVFENPGEGSNDRVAIEVSFALPTEAEVEKLEAVNSGGTTAMDLTGSDSANTIVGNAGMNVIDGKDGNDLLAGLDGADTFAFTTALGAGNVDQIDGFASGADRIALDDAVFAAIAPGALAAGAFVIGSSAQDADDRIIYNSATGALFYDPDGTGAAAAIQFATLSSAPPLSGADFVLV